MAFSIFGKKDSPARPAAAPGKLAPDTVGPGDAGLDMPTVVIHEAGEEIHPLLEQAAIFHANGQDAPALAALEGGVGQDLGPAAEMAWCMLFDLCGLLGKREEFEARALEFAVRFERSPPAWSGAEAAVRSGGSASSMLTGTLNAACEKQLEPARKLIARGAGVRLDVGRLRDADEQGCELLLGLVRAALKAKVDIVLQNAQALTKIIEGRIELGRREREPMWLLLFELLQQQGMQERFEDLALNFAVTFEVSPPSWETRVRPRPGSAAAAPAPEPAEDDVLQLYGELSGARPEVAQKFETHAATRELVVADLSGLKRMDFVCAGMLLNTFATLAAQGKTLRLTNVSAIVAGLLHVVGIGQVAEISLRKY